MVSFSNLQLCIKYKNNFIAECLKENTTRPYTTLLFFSLAFCLFTFFSSTSISSGLSSMQPHMTFVSSIGQICPYETFCFFLLPFVCFVFFLLPLFLQDCLVCNPIWFFVSFILEKIVPWAIVFLFLFIYFIIITFWLFLFFYFLLFLLVSFTYIILIVTLIFKLGLDLASAFTFLPPFFFPCCCALN